MKIAVTGGSGFIGGWLCQTAAIMSHQLVVIGRNDCMPTRHATTQPIDYRQTDYTPPSLTEAFRGCDAVVHLAAARFSDNMRWDLYTENITSSWAVLEACRNCSISNIVMLSSRSVYSSMNNLPWEESQRPIPINLYGAAKAAVENLADTYIAAHGLCVKSLRVADTFGYGERDGYMLTTFIKQAHAGETLHFYGNDASRREYVYVKDVAGAIMAALAKPDLSGIFNIGSGCTITSLALAEMINRIFLNPSGIVTRPNATERLENNQMSVHKASELLNWRRAWTLEEALRDAREIMTRHSTAIDLQVSKTV